MSEWIPHDGGPMPVDGDVLVNWRTREPDYEITLSEQDWEERRASVLRWSHSRNSYGRLFDIIAYRLAETPND